MDRQQGANSTNDTRPPASALVASSDPDLEFSFSRQGERDIPLSNRGIAFRFLMTLIVQIIGISAAIIFGIWSGKSYNIGKEALAAAQQANSFALAIPSATKANDATMALTIVPVVQANKSELSSRPDSQQSTAFSVSTTEPKPPFLTHPAGAVPTNLEEDVFSSAPRVAVAFEGSGNLPAFTTPSKVGFKEPATITTLLVHDTMLASPSVETPILPWSYALLGEMRLANQINLWRLCSDNAQFSFQDECSHLASQVPVRSLVSSVLQQPAAQYVMPSSNRGTDSVTTVTEVKLPQDSIYRASDLGAGLKSPTLTATQTKVHKSLTPSAAQSPTKTEKSEVISVSAFTLTSSAKISASSGPISMGSQSWQLVETSTYRSYTNTTTALSQSPDPSSLLSPELAETRGLFIGFLPLEFVSTTSISTTSPLPSRAFAKPTGAIIANLLGKPINTRPTSANILLKLHSNLQWSFLRPTKTVSYLVPPTPSGWQKGGRPLLGTTLSGGLPVPSLNEVSRSVSLSAAPTLATALYSGPKSLSSGQLPSPAAIPNESSRRTRLPEFSKSGLVITNIQASTFVTRTNPLGRSGQSSLSRQTDESSQGVSTDASVPDIPNPTIITIRPENTGLTSSQSAIITSPTSGSLISSGQSSKDALFPTTTNGGTTMASQPALPSPGVSKDPSPQQEKSSLSLGAIVAIVVGTVSFVVLGIGAFVWFRWKRRSALTNSDATRDGS